MFKKLVVVSLLTLFLSVPVFAGNRMCPRIWDNVQSQTYTLTLGEDTFDVVFSGAYAGPCPQGIIEIYDGIYIAPVLKCRYTSGGDNFVYINCDTDEDIPFILRGNKLELYVPSKVVMERKKVDDND